MGDLASTHLPPRIEVEPEPTPLVSALAADLRAGLSGRPAQHTEGVEGTIAIRDEHTPQAATVTVAGGKVSIAHGASMDADLAATVTLPLGTGPPGEFTPGEDAPAELERWLEAARPSPPRVAGGGRGVLGGAGRHARRAAGAVGRR